MKGGREAAQVPVDEEGVIVGLTHEGEGIVRAGKTAFVLGALPGERIRFRRVKKHRQHDEARLVEVLEPAADRAEPRCKHFGVCGGCALQHLQPESQLAAKQLELKDNLERVARVLPDKWLEPLRGPVWNYRRRARLGAKYVAKKGRVVVGFRERLAPYVAALDRCEVLAPPTDALITPLSDMLTQLSIRERLPQIEVAVADNAVALVLRVLAPPSATDLETLRGFERTHNVRFYLQPAGLDSVHRLPQEGSSTARPVGAVASVGAAPVDSADTARRNEVIDDRFPPRPSASASSAPQPAESALSYSLPAFDLNLEFLPTDFIQINGAINEALVSRAVELLAPEPGSAVLDLFCGLGNFTLALARKAGRVVGVEGDRELVRRAAWNACRNGLENAEFHVANLTEAFDEPAPDNGAGSSGSSQGSASKAAASRSKSPHAGSKTAGGTGTSHSGRSPLMPDWAKHPYPYILLDPPRAGAREMLPTVARLRPKRVLYISCHPGSLARDIGMLVHEYGFRLRAAGVLDMFPHTTHVESIAVLEPADPRTATAS